MPGPAVRSQPLVRKARASDAAPVLALLRSHTGLEADFDAAEFHVAEDGRGVVACGRLRRHPDGAVELASVAVQAGLKGAGVGTRLVEAMLAPPQPVLFALALAPGFFARFGFAEVPRGRLPASVRAKAEGLCASQPYVAMARPASG